MPIIPDHKLSLIATDTESEAAFICALLSSAGASLLIKRFGISTQISVSTIGRLHVPKFVPTNRDHDRLQRLARNCMHAAAHSNDGEIHKFQAEIDKAAAKLWGITDVELKAIQEALAEAKKPRRGKAKDEVEE